jgi:hypothetical protein
MTPRHAGPVDEQLEVGVAAEHMLTLLQSGAAVGPAQSETDPVGLTHACRWFSKRVAESWNCPDESGMCRVVAEGGANLGNQIDEVFLHDERVGPEAFLEVQLRQGLRSLRNEDLQ